MTAEPHVSPVRVSLREAEATDMDAKLADAFHAGAVWRHMNPHASPNVDTPALQRAYEDHLDGQAAIRCCETGHAPAYRKGRVAGQQDIERATSRAHRAGQQVGAVRALLAVAGLGLVALVLRGRRG